MENAPVELARQEPRPTSTTESFDVMGWYRSLGVTVEHPVVKLPTREQVLALVAEGQAGLKRLQKLLDAREELIGLMEKDPLRYGWEPECWKDARGLLEGRMKDEGSRLNARTDLLVTGGNRSAKTEFAAKEAMLDLTTKPNRIWAFLHSSEDSSKRLQHPRLWRYMPPEWKNAGKGKDARTFVMYTEQRGFADNTFILPNGSRAYFFNYKQDPKVLEGYELDGVWADELIPAEFLVALRFRLITRNGRLILTFTPVDGYTAVVGDYLAAAKVIKSLRSELLPGENVKGVPAGEMPYIMECVHPKRAIIFFFTEFNAFNPYEVMKRELATLPREKVKMRAYGYPEKLGGVQFPKFGEHNLVEPEAIPQDGTNYWYCDFAWNRNWYMIWLRVWEHKGRRKIWVWKEWPDYQRYGEWVLPSEKPDGERGPAQGKTGMGWVDYKRLLKSVERGAGNVGSGERGAGSGEKEGKRKFDKVADKVSDKDEGVTIFEYRGDPRSGAAEQMTLDSGGTSAFEVMREEFTLEDGAVCAGYDVLPSRAGRNIQDGINLVNGWLEYDEHKAIGFGNEPVLMVSRECRQLIDCLRMWTGRDGLKGASKDPIDLLRYAAQDDVQFVEEGALGSEAGGSY